MAHLDRWPTHSAPAQSNPTISPVTHSALQPPRPFASPCTFGWRHSNSSESRHSTYHGEGPKPTEGRVILSLELLRQWEEGFHATLAYIGRRVTHVINTHHLDTPSRQCPCPVVPALPTLTCSKASLNSARPSLELRGPQQEEQKGVGRGEGKKGEPVGERAVFGLAWRPRPSLKVRFRVRGRWRS